MRILVFFLAMFALPQAPQCAQIPQITNEPASQSVLWAGVNVTFVVGVSGSGPFTYQWQFNTTNLPNIITTIAGNGIDNYSGDGGVATNASFDFPEGVAVDASGNLFIADTDNNCIRKVNTNGIVTTIAGGGASSPGDGGAATNANLSQPCGVAVDASGNLFIADEDDYRIHKVNTNGIIVTVAGNGTNGYSGDGGAATNASLCLPSGVAVDAFGNLFIADQNNNRIRKVNTNGIITTVAGIGAAGQGYGYSGDGGAATNAKLFWPYGVAVDTSGNLFIADSANQRIRKVNTNGIITTVAGIGPSWPSSGSYSGDGSAATNASLSEPSCVAVDATGNLFIADTDNSLIRKVDVNGIITTFAGGGANGLGDGCAATNASLSGPFGVAVDTSGNLFIADTVNFRIREVSNTQEPVLILNNVNAANAGNYQVVVTCSVGSVTSSVAILTVVPSFITQQPQDQMVLTSSNATFSVSASGATPMSYQWFFSNTNLQTDAGAIAEILYGFVYGAVVTNVGSGYTTVPNVQFIGGGGSGAGGTAVVSNGMVTTINVTNAGSDYTTLPAVQIDPPSGLLIGQTNATLNLNTVTTDNAGNYFVVVSNVYGSVTSSVATLIIVAGPAIVHQPQSVSVLEGNNATFNACASGTTPLSYQWWMGASQQSNATAVPFIINGFVLAANITSGGAGYLTVPEVQFVGGSGSGASGIAVVSNRVVTAINMISAGSGYTTPPTIQIDAPSAVILPGQTNATLLISAATGDNIGNYFVVVTNNYGSVTSATAGLVVFLPALNIVGSSSNNYQLTLQLTGNPNYPYTLQSATNLTPPVNWQTVLTNFADTNGNWSAIITNLANPPAGFYRIVGQ